MLGVEVPWHRVIALLHSNRNDCQQGSCRPTNRSSRQSTLQKIRNDSGIAVATAAPLSPLQLQEEEK